MALIKSRKRVPDLYIENGQIVFKNFAGVARQFNHEGDRNFCVFIDDPEMAERMREDGWNVKIRAPREDGEEPRNYIKVNVSYRYQTPDVYVISGRKRVPYTEEMIGALDQADVMSADLTIQASVREDEDTGETKISGYLREAYFTLRESHWADKYGDLDEESEDEYYYRKVNAEA